jgi:hypothetical protein
MATQIQLRNGTASAWTTANPTLAIGELGVETDTGKFKVGTGASAWTSLTYATGFTYRGNWVSGTSYVVNDIVYYTGTGGGTYICTTNTSSATAPPSLTGSWGKIALTGVDGVTFTWKGAWASGTSYAANDVVSQSGSSYICILAASGSGQSPTNTTYWSLLASAGAMTGPVSSVNNNIAVFNGTSGATLKDSGVSYTSFATTGKAIAVAIVFS